MMPKILLVDDDINYRKLIKETLMLIITLFMRQRSRGWRRSTPKNRGLPA